MYCEQLFFRHENKKDCYLETLTFENVKIYERYGFDLVQTEKVPNTDLTLYAMYRKHKENIVEKEQNELLNVVQNVETEEIKSF